MEGHATSTTGSASAATSTGGTSTGSVTSVTSPSSTDAIIQRLIRCGVPQDYLERGQAGVADYVKVDSVRLPEVINALFPGPDDVQASSLSGADEVQGPGTRKEFQNLCRDALKWVKWAMFQGEPHAVLAGAGQGDGGARGVCGAVWGSNDIAYRCRTCEHDPTCAICVPCFQNGNHATHDYSMIRTGGGCCDCGDITAWKESGFCSRHCGPGQVAPLPLPIVEAASPVLEALLHHWVYRLKAGELSGEVKYKKWNQQTVEEKVASQLSAVCIDMLLEFCNYGETMLAFTAERVGNKNIGLLHTLMSTECFLPKAVGTSLHELLYKLLGDTNFKHVFAQTFISHYPKFLRDLVAEEAATPGTNRSREQAILNSFSVQIFTVPTLTPKLVMESGLLDMLLETLKEFLRACVGEDGRLMVGKGPIVKRHYSRIIEDIRYVMSHLEVAQFVAEKRSELARAWLHLVAFVQGVYLQRRITSIHVEEENEDWGSAYFLEVQMATIHPLFVAGAAASGNADANFEQLSLSKSRDDFQAADIDTAKNDDSLTRPVKVGCVLREPDVVAAGTSSGGGSESDVEMCDVTITVDATEYPPSESNLHQAEKQESAESAESAVISFAGMTIPTSLVWLISECTQVLDTWLMLDTARESTKTGQLSVDAGQVVGQRRGTQWRGRGGRGMRDPPIQIPPIPTAGEPPPGPAPGAGAAAADGEGTPPPFAPRVGTIREWLRRTRRFTVLEARVWSEFARDQSATGTNAASESQAADMDVDVLQAGASEAGRCCDIGTPEWWMGPETVNAASAGSQLFEDEEWPAIDFDVSRQEVSFHIPLHRMLALLLHKALDLCSTVSETPADGEPASAAGDGHGEKLLAQMFRPRLQVPGFAAVLMEHPLRLQVLCGQVQAGMWRRNGHSTSGLCDLYHTVHWCEDSLELDLFLLQCCSVLAPPEEFVERIQARFSLSDYFTLVLWRPNEYEKSAVGLLFGSLYEVTLAQELLVLLIRLVSERGFCGLTEVEALRRELVQRLAVGDATHSALLKALPPRLQDSKHVQECLDSVATYRNPSGMQQGKYVLREECWRELDLYHPRWSPRELQSAEERYLRACKAPAVFMQLPRWKPPFKQLQAMGRFITSARVHDMLRSVFFHSAFAQNQAESRAPEGLLFTALHLLALALDVCAAAPNNARAKSKDVDCPGPAVPLFDPNTDSYGTNSCSECDAEDQPPLLLRSTERVPVRRADGAAISDPQSMLSLLVLLLRKFSTGDNAGVADVGLYNAVGLIKTLLGKFAELNRGCMIEIESIAPEVLHHHSARSKLAAGGSGETSFKDDTVVSEAELRRAISRERQAAVMAKMKAAQERFVVSYQSTEESSGQAKGDEADAKRPKESGGGSDSFNEDSQVTHCALCRDSASASPLCFLIFIQRSKLLGIAEKPTPSWQRGLVTVAQVEREGETPGGPSTATTSGPDVHSTAELWHWIQEALGDTQTRTRLLEGEDLLELLRNGLPPGIRNTARVAPGLGLETTTGAPGDTEPEQVESTNEITEAENSNEAGTSEAPGGLFVNWWEDNHGGAEQEENSTDRDNAAATVLAEYVAVVSQPQERLRRRGTESPRQADTEQAREIGLPRGRRTAGRSSAPPIAEATMYNSIGMNDTVGIYLSACGHAVHQECRDRYFSSLLQRYYSRALFEGVQIVDPAMGEFLCPVCRRLANSVLPVLPGHTGLNSSSKTSNIPRLSMGSTSCRPPTLQVEHALRLLVKAEELVSKSGFRKVVDPQLPDTVKGVLEDLSKRLCELYYPEKDPFTLFHGRVHQGLLLWDVFRYSLMSAELAARSHKVIGNMASGLVALVEVGDASHGSVLPLLLHAARATQSQSRQAVLLRARGMQLLLDSIANGISRDLSAEKALPGNLASLLQYLDKGHDSADVQFWKRLADPVLVHDPFSSFLWLLFCLPLPFPANGSPFTALVHLFYLVSVTQIIAQAGSFLALDTELAPSALSFVAAVHGGLIGTRLQPLSEEDAASIPAGSPTSVIRRMTLPFLRRCYLLQSLMSGSSQVLPVARAHQWELPQRHGLSMGASSSSIDSRDAESQVLQEMEELDQLESVFCIPPLQKILEQDAVQYLVLSWCRHVKTDTGVRFFQQIPRLITAAPFRMMQLPHLFQDLLQRYVKERCPRCSTVPERPALCLLCGALCCAVGPRPCCSMNRQGECYRHAMTCGAGIGIFLMLRRTNILLQRCERQAMWPSLYLDAFGEEDIELRRGKPLFLSQERYAALTAMVAAHGLDYCSPVLSQTTRDTVF